MDPLQNLFQGLGSIFEDLFGSLFGQKKKTRRSSVSPSQRSQLRTLVDPASTSAKPAQATSRRPRAKCGAGG